MVLKDFVAPEWRARVFAEAGVPDPSAPDDLDDGEVLDADEGVISEEDDDLFGFGAPKPAKSEPKPKPEPKVEVKVEAKAAPAEKKEKKPEKPPTMSTPLLEETDEDLFAASRRVEESEDDLLQPPTMVDSGKQKKKKKKKKEKAPDTRTAKAETHVPLQATAANNYGATQPSTIDDLVQPRTQTKKEFTATNMYHVGFYSDHNTFKGEPLWILFLLAMFTNIDIGIVFPSLFSLLAVKYNALSYGLTVGAFGIGQLIAGPVARSWAERPLRELLLVASLVSAAGNWIFIFLGQQDTWEFLLIGRVVAGMGSSYILTAGLSITRLSPRGVSGRMRLGWFRMLTLSSRLFGALLGLLLVQVNPSPPYSFTVGGRTIVVDPTNGGIFILACLFTLMFFIQAFYFGCASSRAPRDYTFLDAEGEEEAGSVDLGASGRTHTSSHAPSSLWFAVLYGSTVFGAWLGSTMFFPFVAGRYGWGLKEQYILASVALLAGWVAALLQPLVQRCLATPSLGQGPSALLLPDKADTSSSLGISSGLSIGTVLASASTNYQIVKIGLALELFGALALFAYFDNNIYEEQIYVSFGCLAAGYTLVLSLIVAVVNDRRMASSQYPGHFLSPTNPLFGVLLAISAVGQAVGPLVAALVMDAGDGKPSDLMDGFEVIRIMLLSLALIGIFAHGLGSSES